MKTRVLTAAIGIPLLLLLVFAAPIWAFGIIWGVACMIAAYELLHCALPDAPKRIYASSMVCAFFFPVSFSMGFEIRWSIWIILLLFFIFSLELILSFHGEKRLTLEMVALSMLAGVILPMMLSTLARIGREPFSGRARMFLPFVIAFASDAGALFAGLAFGRHKLAPHVSPNKTIEGSVGGVICGALCTLLYGLILKASGLEVNLLSLTGFGLLGSLISQLGDLTFSAIKREYGIKDYGNILPGHGGVLDRFDSLCYLAPLTEFWMLIAPAIW